MKNIKTFKTTHILLVLYILLAAFTAVSCNNLTTQEQKQSQKTVLKVILQDEARTVSPELLLTQLSNFKLTGQKAGDDNPVVNLGNASGYATAADLAAEEFALPDDASGSYWNFTLTAEFNAGDVTQTYSCTSGITVVAGQNAVGFTFVFESEYNQGTGDFSVSFDCPENAINDGKFDSFTAVFENIDGTEVSDSINSKITKSEIVNNAFTVSGDDIPAGIYRLKISLEKNNARVAYWQEVVKIAGGFESTAAYSIQDFLDAYTITYHLNNDSNDVQTSAVSIATDLLQPQRAGYTFINWYTDSACQHVFDIKTLSSNIDLYAKWFGENDMHMATKDTIASRIASATETGDPSNPFVIQAFGPFTHEDFSAAQEALEQRNGAENLYIALDFSEVQTDIEDFEYFISCTRLAGITIPDSVLPYDWYDDWWSYAHGVKGSSFRDAPYLQYINASDNNPNYSSIDGVLCNKSGTKIVAFPRGKTCANNTYTTPATIERIENEAFYGGLSINTVIIGENVHLLDNECFKYTTTVNGSITVSFVDNTHAWYGGSFSGYYFNIEEMVKKEMQYNGSGTLMQYFSWDSRTFAQFLADAQPTSVTVAQGAGSVAINYNLETTEYNTITITDIYKETWLSFPTVPGRTYYVYYCDAGKAQNDQFTNIPEGVNFCYEPRIFFYSGDGSCYIDGLGINGAAQNHFTAVEKQGVENVAYVCMRGYSSWTSNINSKVYLLIREVE